MASMLVLGLGKSGVASARHALSAGEELTIYAGTANDATKAAAREFEEAGVPVIFDVEDIEGSFDTCVVSPGIPQSGSFYASAKRASKEIISEPEYAWRLSPRSWIAVTGTNGKTTTTSFVTHLLNCCGKSAYVCGNIGMTCIGAVEHRGEDEVLVAEMSSYQLASTVGFAPQVAILLNITPDHISWHGGFDAYAQAKFKVFENMEAGSTAIVGASVLDAYPELQTLLEGRGVRLVTVGVPVDSTCAFEDAEGMLVYQDESGQCHELVSTRELGIQGAHNVENALCAASAALAFGCPFACVRKGLTSFKPLEHRLEPCGSVDGIDFFNDSKATNVDATLKALTAFPDRKIVLLLGGRDKMTALDELVEACADVCRAVVVYGEAGERFHEAFADSPVDSYLETGMKQALDCACEVAQPGDAIVLSPACASFDEFDSFEHRGQVFKECVSLRTRA